MNTLRDTIYNKIISDSTTLNMLKPNKAWWDKKLAADKKYSVIEPANLSADLVYPLITLQIGPENKIANVTIPYYARIVYIRVYVEEGFGYILAENILARIYQLLNKTSLALNPELETEIEYYYSLGDSYDDGIKKPYIEHQYQALLIK